MRKILFSVLLAFTLPLLSFAEENSESHIIINNSSHTKIKTNISVSANSSNGVSTSSVRSTINADPEHCTAITRDLSFGSEGAEVRSLQEFLNSQGFPIEVVGIFGPRTKFTVESFQRAQGIHATGFVGPITRGVMQKIVCNSDSGNSSVTTLSVTASGSSVNNNSTVSVAEMIKHLEDTLAQLRTLLKKRQ
jgi:peptidoglycan hydrolase-like protein with peptidoglycan-binding domain